MKIFLNVILVILVFLAISSGVTKVMLLPPDVEFFGRYGFANPVLMAFGAVQIIGGVLLVIPKTRFVGAVIVAITFLVSLIVLIMDGNTLFTIFTVIAMILLGVIMKHSHKKQ
ncbi:MAG: DoxX family protein [Gammaproteobacteria bacterium]|nr:DoxX family protein [Gammaproteobacteria bacterium]